MTNAGNFSAQDLSTATVLQRMIAVTAILCMALLQGCVTFQPASAGRPMAEQVSVGDKIRVTTSAGEQREFVVSRLDKEGVYDGDDYLLFADMTELKIQKVSKSSQVAGSTVIVGIVLLGVLVLLIINGLEDSVESAFDN